MRIKSITILLISVFYISTFQKSNAQWVQTSSGIGDVIIFSLANNGSNLFAGTYSNGLYLSTNNGANWTQTSLSNQVCQSLAASGNNIFAGTLSNGVFLSTNNGISWNQTSLNNRTVRSLAISGNNIFAATATGDAGVLLSTNNGTSWTQTSLINKIIYSLTVNGSNIFAGAYDTGVYLSTNSGVSWIQTSLNNRRIYSLAHIGDNIFAGTSSSGIYLSTNNGTNWTQTSLNSSNGFSLAVYGNNIYAGMGFASGVHVSTDNGTSWTQRNEGLNNLYIYAFSILNNSIYVGTAGMGVYRRPLSDLTNINSVSNEIPNEISLSQNYPNPFNPVTKIKFSIPHTQYIIVKVYDALGKELETLVSEQLNAGSYESNWNASDYPSGIYFYTLNSENFSQTNKMVLLK